MTTFHKLGGGGGGCAAQNPWPLWIHYWVSLLGCCRTLTVYRLLFLYSFFPKKSYPLKKKKNTYKALSNNIILYTYFNSSVLSPMLSLSFVKIAPISCLTTVVVAIIATEAVSIVTVCVSPTCTVSTGG